MSKSSHYIAVCELSNRNSYTRALRVWYLYAVQTSQYILEEPEGHTSQKSVIVTTERKTERHVHLPWSPSSTSPYYSNDDEIMKWILHSHKARLSKKQLRWRKYCDDLNIITGEFWHRCSEPFAPGCFHVISNKATVFHPLSTAAY